MDLGQPDRVETPALGGVDLLESGVEGLGLALPRAPLKLMEDAKFECLSSLLLSNNY